MELRIVVVHKDLRAKEYADRLAVVESLARISRLQTLPSLTDPPSFETPPDCLVVHESQDTDVGLAGLYCTNQSQVPRLIAFGGRVSSVAAIDHYGLKVPEAVFLNNAPDFFVEWVRRDEFPGWEFLVGEPELELALEILHGLLPGVYGAAQENVEAQWKAFKKMRKDFDSGAEGDKDLWSEADEAFRRCSNNSNDIKENLSALRDLLLGEPPDKAGLVKRLARLRKQCQ
jgi:hypothetical protein